MSAACEVHIDREVRSPSPVFADRMEAGVALAGYLALDPDPEAVVLGLPRGGVPVAAPLARRLGVGLDTIIVRKLPIPSSPEMGFGAVTLGGGVQLNRAVVERFRISEEEIKTVTEEVSEELRRRARAYRGTVEPPDVAGRDVTLVDDGLATGYTALAAARTLRSLGARTIRIAAPVTPADSIERVREAADEVAVLLAQVTGSFAVASYYETFPELRDAEILALLRGNESERP